MDGGREEKIHLIDTLFGVEDEQYEGNGERGGRRDGGQVGQRGRERERVGKFILEFPRPEVVCHWPNEQEPEEPEQEPTN